MQLQIFNLSQTWFKEFVQKSEIKVYSDNW